MNSVYREIEDGLRDELRQRVGRQRFKLWFRDTAVVDVSEDALTLAVPNDVHCTWLQYTYAEEDDLIVDDLVVDLESASAEDLESWQKIAVEAIPVAACGRTTFMKAWNRV